MKRLFFLISLASLFTGVISCNKDNYNDNSNNPINVRDVTVRLTTDGGRFDAVNLDIQGVEFITLKDSVINIPMPTPGVYNLMSYKNGLDVLLAEAKIPAEEVGNVKLILGTNNSVVMNGVEYPLSLPAASDTSMYILLNQSFTAIGSYKIWLALDAMRSIKMVSDNQYAFIPKGRTYSDLTNGVITGFVYPKGLNTTVYAVNEVFDTVTASPVDTGYFAINGLSRRNYTVIIHDNSGAYQDYVQGNLYVIYDIPTNIGNITMLPK